MNDRCSGAAGNRQALLKMFLKCSARKENRI